MILLRFFGYFHTLLTGDSCLKYCNFTKLSQIKCLINVHILVCQHAKCDCKLWKVMEGNQSCQFLICQYSFITQKILYELLHHSQNQSLTILFKITPNYGKQRKFQNSCCVSQIFWIFFFFEHCFLFLCFPR